MIVYHTGRLLGGSADAPAGQRSKCANRFECQFRSESEDTRLAHVWRTAKPWKLILQRTAAYRWKPVGPHTSDKMPINMKDAEEVKDFLEGIGIEYRFGCLKENKPDACHLLGDYLEAIKKDFARAAQVYKDNCDEHAHGKSCHKFANYAFNGRGTPLDKAAAYAYQMKACEAKCPEGCLMAALQLINPKESGVAEDVVKAVQLFERGCELGYDESCFQASGIYIDGREPVQKNLQKAFELSKKACELGCIPACSNVALMYTRGIGVKKDKAQALVYREKILDFRQQLQSQSSLNMEEGIKDT